MGEKRIKVAFLPHALTGGGAEKVVTRILRHLDRERGWHPLDRLHPRSDNEVLLQADPIAVHYCLMCRSVPALLTLIRGISKLPPGQWRSLDR